MRKLDQCFFLFYLATTFLQLENGRAVEAKVLPGDSPVVIHGRIGDDNSFVQRVGLIAPAAVPELIFRSTDLQRSDGKGQIGRQQVGLTSTAKIELARNTPKDVEIKVSGIKAPGVYKGDLYFLQLDQELSAALRVPVQVIAEGVPKLTQRKGSESVKIQLIDCNWLGCTIARLLQPGAFLTRYPLLFDNGSQEDFDMAVRVSATGEATHDSLEDVVGAQSPAHVPLQPVYSLPIQVHDARPLPDHYVGDVQLLLPAQDAPLKIPLELNVRAGPILPILVLLLGILMGRLLKYMKDKGGPRSDLLPNLYYLENRIAVLPADAQLLQPMLDSAKTSIYNMQLDLAKMGCQ